MGDVRKWLPKPGRVPVTGREVGRQELCSLLERQPTTTLKMRLGRINTLNSHFSPFHLPPGLPTGQIPPEARGQGRPDGACLGSQVWGHGRGCRVKSRSAEINEKCPAHQCFPNGTHLNTIFMNLSYPACTTHSLFLNIF